MNIRNEQGRVITLLSALVELCKEKLKVTHPNIRFLYYDILARDQVLDLLYLLPDLLQVHAVLHVLRVLHRVQLVLGNELAILLEQLPNLSQFVNVEERLILDS